MQLNAFRFVGCAVLLGLMQVAPAGASVYSTTDLGRIDSFAVAVEPLAHTSGLDGVTNLKQLTFSLGDAADIRIDVRYVHEDCGKVYFNCPRVYDPVLNLFDANHTLLGTSSIDPLFSQSSAIQDPFTHSLSVTTNVGATFDKQLGAGQYSIEFSGRISAPGLVLPELHFGVAKDTALASGAYLSQLTPPGAAVPEPSSTALMGLGLMWGALRLRKRSA